MEIAWGGSPADIGVSDWRLEKKIRKAMMDVQNECEVIPRDFLCCKLCEEEYKNPKHLVCFHSFCRQCIIDYMRKHCEDAGTYWCPICGTETDVEELGLNDLPDNLLARRLSSPAIETQERDKICKICKNGGNFIDAKSYCINCDDFFCQQCTDAHMAQDETASHKVETMEEYQVRTEFEESGKKMHVVPRCCSYYDPLDIGALFCVDCDSAVCADCHLSYHEDHRCAEMVAVAENFQNKIKQPLDELQNDATQLQEAMINLQKAELQTIEQQKELHATVSRRKKYLSDMINEYENVLLEEIDRRHTQHLDDIHQRRKEMQMHLAAIDGVNDFTEKLVSYGSFEEKVLMRKKVGKRVRELCEEPLMIESMELEKITLREPNVAIETICNMFGELSSNNVPSETDIDDRAGQMYQTSVDSGHGSEVADTNELNTGIGGQEIIESESDVLESTNGSDFKMLTLSNTSDGLRNVTFREEVDQTEYEADNCFTLDMPKREITLPQTIQHECLKGMGINKHGDIIVGASAANYQMVYLLEKRGIIRGQIPVQTGWNIHSVSSDGKVALTIARGDNRFKVRIMKNDGSGQMLTNTQIENMGLNFATADQNGQLIVTSNRYSHITNFGKMTSKAGGNIALFDKNGVLKRRITNEDYLDLGMYILEKPHTIAIDNDTGCFFVTDPSMHNVTGYDRSGELMFEYGNTDLEPEVYDGPDLVCTDTQGHILVADKRLGKIDVLNHKGELKKSLFTEDIVKFISVTPEKLLMLATAEGNIKFYEYLNL